MKKLLVYLKPYAKESAAGPLLKLTEAAMDLAVPVIVGRLIDDGIAAGNMRYAAGMAGVLVALAAAGLTIAILAQFFAAKAAVGFVTGVRRALFAHLGTLSYSDVDRLGAASLITRMTSDMAQLQNGTNLTLRLLLRSPFVVLGSTVMAFVIDLRAGLLFLAAVAVLACVVFGVMLRTVPMYRGVQEQLDDVTDHVGQTLTGARVVRAFCREESERTAFAARADRLNRLQKAVGRVSALLNPVTFLLINLAVVWLIHTGAVRVEAGSLSQGQVVALYNYMAQILVELIKGADLFILLTKAIACGNRIEAVMELRSSMTFPAEAPAEDPDAPAVSFEDVTLAYNDADPALTRVSFSVRRGQTVGVVGSTGSGKTSLVNLIPRFYDATGGVVRVNGADVRDYPEKTLRDKIGVVPQKAVLFRGTIRENLLWGSEDATREELEQAVHAAQCDDVIAAKPEGLDAPVEQAGRNFSGGQRQRLTIARALVRRPEILILDDSASALDMATDLRLRQAIASLPGDMTVFIVSQRASSVMQADVILVLEDGVLAACGDHETLLKTSEIYREIYESQFGEAVHHG